MRKASLVITLMFFIGLLSGCAFIAKLIPVSYPKDFKLVSPSISIKSSNEKVDFIQIPSTWDGCIYKVSGFTTSLKNKTSAVLNYSETIVFDFVKYTPNIISVKIDSGSDNDCKILKCKDNQITLNRNDIDFENFYILISCNYNDMGILNYAFKAEFDSNI